MALIDDYLREAGEGAVIVCCAESLRELRRATPVQHWQGQHSYRGARVELREEWGWIVRRANGDEVEGVRDD